MTIAQAMRALRGYRWLATRLEHRLGELPDDLAQQISMAILMDEARPVTPESDVDIRLRLGREESRRKERLLLETMKKAVFQAAQANRRN